MKSFANYICHSHFLHRPLPCFRLACIAATLMCLWFLTRNFPDLNSCQQFVIVSNNRHIYDLVNWFLFDLMTFDVWSMGTSTCRACIVCKWHLQAEFKKIYDKSISIWRDHKRKEKLRDILIIAARISAISLIDVFKLIDINFKVKMFILCLYDTQYGSHAIYSHFQLESAWLCSLNFDTIHTMCVCL